MAVFTPGPAIGAISGSIGGTTFSHNKGGPYMRRRGIPTTTPTDAQLDTRARLIQISQAYAGLTPGEKLSWRTYAENTPIVNALGNQIRATAHQCFVGINSLRLKLGDGILDVPVQGAAPVPLLTMVLSTDIGAGDFEVAFTTTPLGAGVKLYVRGCLVDSSGVAYVKNRLVYFAYSAAALVSPYNIESEFAAKFGTPAIGQVAWIEARAYDEATGLMSAPILGSSVIVTT